MRDDRERLLDILEAIDRIFRYVDRGKDAFDGDELIQTWMIHHIEVVGEAAGQVSEELRRAHSEIPWALVVGMRNLLIHRYFGVDPEEVWVAVSRDLPPLRAQIESLLETLPEA